MPPPLWLTMCGLRGWNGQTARMPALWLRQIRSRLGRTRFRTKTSAAPGAVSSRLPPLAIAISKGNSMLTTRHSRRVSLPRRLGPDDFRRLVARLLGLAAVAFVLLSPPLARAAVYYWDVPAGDWSQAANWGGVLPTSSDSA